MVGRAYAVDAGANDSYLSGFQRLCLSTVHPSRFRPHIYKGMVEANADWWRTWFGPSYLALYDRELAQRTPDEIDQLEALLRITPPLRILDLPCGQGRHSIELARRGYEVTGVDLSPFLLGIARERARSAGVGVRWQVGDMREPLAGQRFDLVLNLFTSFGYFADEADDRKVIAAASAMLGPGGRFVLEVINGDRMAANFEEREWYPVGDIVVMERRSLDRSTRRMVVERTVETTGESTTDIHIVRLYGADELQPMMGEAGFEHVEFFGDWSGGAATPDSLRVIAVATAPSLQGRGSGKEKGGS